MAMKKLLFVFNPFSGKGLVKLHLFTIINTLTAAGYEVTAHPTQSKNDACETILSRGEDFDVIVCSGGDGTLNESIKGIMSLSRKIPLGYIPAGTMNDFAACLGISKNMPEAVKKIVEGKTAEVDVGSFNEDYFTYVAGFGAFTDVSYETPQQMKNMFGSLAYIVEGLKLKRLSSTKAYHITIEHDGESYTDDFIYGMIANSNSIAGIKGLSGKNILLNDGIFEGLFIKMPKTLAELQMTINALLMREMDSKHFYYFKSGGVVIRSDDEISWTLDGEYGGNSRNVVIKNNCRAVVIFTSPDSKLLGGTSEIELPVESGEIAEFTYDFTDKQDDGE